MKVLSRSDRIRKEYGLPAAALPRVMRPVWHLALLLCVLLCLGTGMEASAAEKGSEQENSGQETSENLVMIRVEGQLEETDRTMCRCSGPMRLKKLRFCARRRALFCRIM